MRRVGSPRTCTHTRNRAGHVALKKSRARLESACSNLHDNAESSRADHSAGGGGALRLREEDSAGKIRPTYVCTYVGIVLWERDRERWSPLSCAQRSICLSTLDTGIYPISVNGALSRGLLSLIVVSFFAMLVTRWILNTHKRYIRAFLSLLCLSSHKFSASFFVLVSTAFSREHDLCLSSGIFRRETFDPSFGSHRGEPRVSRVHIYENIKVFLVDRVLKRETGEVRFAWGILRRFFLTSQIDRFNMLISMNL